MAEEGVVIDFVLYNDVDELYGFGKKKTGNRLVSEQCNLVTTPA